jgi:Immunoglobulin I-set domain/Immunoglobulin domain
MKPSHYFQQSKPEFCQNSTRRNRLASLLNALMALVAILALSATSARAFTNYLANPGFELGTTAGWSMVPPWTWNPMTSYSAVQNTSGFVYPSPTVHVTVHGGTNAVKIWGYNQNTYTTTPGLQQTFGAAPGSQWTADGWVSTQVPDNIRGNSAGVSELAYLRVMFLDTPANYGSPLASYTSPAIDTNSPTGTWIQLQVTNTSGGTALTAPVGTTLVRYEMIFSQPSVGGVNPGGSSYWDDVELFKTSGPDPEITAQPAPVQKIYGQTATFSVVADGLSTLSYKWQKDGADISNPNAYGVTTSTLTLSNVTTAMMGNYTVTVTDLAGPLTSGPASLTVLDPGVISITPPLGQTKTEGQTATIAVVAAGSSGLTYAWQKDGTPLSNVGHISGATSSTLTVANLTTADTGTYTLMINGGTLATNGLKVVSLAQLATNLLVNPGFEDGVLSEPWETAWVKFNGVVLQTANDFYYLSATPVSVWDGTYVCEVYGSDADDGVNQNVPVTAGATYHAGGWFYMSSASPVAGTVTVTMQLMFKNAGGTTLTTFTAPVIDVNFVPDTWISLQVTNATGGTDLVAPAGTVSATCQIYEFNWSYAGGNVYFDDLYLTHASQSAPPAVTIAASALGGLMNLTFPTTSGVTYEVLYTDSLTSPITWYTNSTIVGDGTVKGVSDPIGATQRFYRVLEHY